jgi:hypothetical protein
VGKKKRGRKDQQGLLKERLSLLHHYMTDAAATPAPRAQASHDPARADWRDSCVACQAGGNADFAVPPADAQPVGAAARKQESQRDTGWPPELVRLREALARAREENG